MKEIIQHDNDDNDSNSGIDSNVIGANVGVNFAMIAALDHNEKIRN